MARENNSTEWDSYWEEEKSKSLSTRAYSVVANFYRQRLIGPRLFREINKNFPKGSTLLHAGSGAGEVDRLLRDNFRIVALDISTNALNSYKENYSDAKIQLGDITNLGNIEDKYDGVYNLGVMEHLSNDEVRASLLSFQKVLKPGGKVVLFWPPSYGTSVLFLHLVHFILKVFGKGAIRLHPDEPNKAFSKKKLRPTLLKTKFKINHFSLSYRDFFTYIVIVLELETI
jgi:2-polyprenyl-3-methyl-5-hydroxy-6-metoxy-1,4-benzoquinol methylase